MLFDVHPSKVVCESGSDGGSNGKAMAVEMQSSAGLVRDVISVPDFLSNKLHFPSFNILHMSTHF